MFVNDSNFGYDNYADYYLDRDYTHNLFQRRLARFHSRPIQVQKFERIVKRRLPVVQVQERELQTEKQKVKVVVPVGEEELVRKNANKTVRQVIAPAFAKNQKVFKGQTAQNEKAS